MTSKIFKRVEHIEQGSLDWHKWRTTVIGASDASAIMNENPWKSRQILLREKSGQKEVFRGNAATVRGSRLEPIARSIYCEMKGLDFFPAIVQNLLNPWQAASLDGIDPTGCYLVEIKCGEKSHLHTLQTGKVPRYYYAQLQHILSVTGIDSIDYFSYQPNQSPILMNILRDDEYIKELMRIEREFAEELQSLGHVLQGLNMINNQEINNEILNTVLSIPPKDLISGETVNGFLHGLGYVRYKSGGFYVGQWSENNPNGKGIHAWSEKSEGTNHWYLGDIKNGLRHGEGTYIWPDGRKYIGNWHEGKQEGEGTLLESDGSVYIGTFAKGQKHGFGRLCLKNGITYLGNWSQGKRHGKGKTILHDGGIFDGEYKNDLIDGQGISIDGSERYEGTYIQGLKEGYGNFVASNGTRYEGYFKQDKFEGSGVCVWPDGSSFKGGWACGKPDGIGLYTTPNGISHEGIWKNGFSTGLFKHWIIHKLSISEIFIDELGQNIVAECSISIHARKKIIENKKHSSVCREYLDNLKSRISLHILQLHKHNANDRVYCCNQFGHDTDVEHYALSLYINHIESVKILEEFCDQFETDASDSGYYIHIRPVTHIKFYLGNIDKNLYIWAYDERSILRAKNICIDDHHESTYEWIRKLISMHNQKAIKFLIPVTFHNWDSNFSDTEISELIRTRRN